MNADVLQETRQTEETEESEILNGICRDQLQHYGDCCRPCSNVADCHCPQCH